MSAYLLLKWVHVLSSVVLVGTGFGTAFYMFFAQRSGDLGAQAVVARLVVRADWWFTTPAAVIQPLTGVALAHLAGWPLSTPWIATSLGLFLLAGACWLPVLVLQMRIADAAQAALRDASALPDVHRRWMRWWVGLGIVAFTGMLAIFYLMVAKPPLQ